LVYDSDTGAFGAARAWPSGDQTTRRAATEDHSWTRHTDAAHR
jgi:hypothetical protein